MIVQRYFWGDKRCGGRSGVCEQPHPLVVIVGGLFDVRASSLHSAPIAWAMQRSFRNHVHRQAASLAAVGPFTQAQVLAGFRDYDSSCVS